MEEAEEMKRLSYADTLFIIALVLAFLLAFTLGLSLYHDSRSLAKALDDGYVSDEIYYVDVARRILTNIFNYKIPVAWPYSGKTEPNYMNPEHPPLGKYIIALSMILCGDKPLCWRLPGAIEIGIAPLIIVLAYVAKGDLRKKVTFLLAGIASMLAFYSDISVRYESAVALLDIHQAFFELVALALLIRGNFLWGLVALGLAGSVKYSGFFLLPAFWVYIGYSEPKRNKRILLFLLSLIIPLGVLLLINIPYIRHFGFSWWWENSVIGAIKWHTTSRPPGPPTSTPFQWFLNANPFYFSYNVMIGGVVKPILYITALILGAINLIIGLPSRRTRAIGSLGFYSILAMYLLLYIIGNKTLYSFYVVQLAPPMAITYGDFVLNVFGEDRF